MVSSTADRIRWRELQPLLRLQLLLDFKQRGLQFATVLANVEDASARRFRQLVHGPVPAIIQNAVDAGIGYQQHVHDGIGLLCGFHCRVKLLLTAVVSALCDQNERLAPRLVVQRFIRRKINRIIQERAARTANGWNRRVRIVSRTGVDLRSR